jgi:predicted acyltransferase
VKERYYSLDLFRGATVAFMILVNNQMGTPYEPLDHAPWFGLTPTDLVFPFFLFAVGNALAFVMPRLRQESQTYVLQKIFRRSVLIFLIGFLLNWMPFFRWSGDRLVFKTWTWVNEQGQLAGVRVMSVLGRIALCYLFGALIVYFFKIRGALLFSISLLLGYWLICYALGASGEPYSLSGYFGTAVDKAVFGPEHLYHGEGVAFDPEGLASTIAAITQVIFGYFVGWYIQQKGKNYSMLRALCLAAVIALVLGYAWSFVFPVSKKIWTSSFVLVSTGYAILSLVLLIYIVEFKSWRGWGSRFFDVFGKNPLFIFVLSGLIPRLAGLIRIETLDQADGRHRFLSPLGWFYNEVCRPLTGDHLKNASLLYSCILVLVYWFIGYILDRKKVYLRL